MMRISEECLSFQKSILNFGTFTVVPPKRLQPSTEIPEAEEAGVNNQYSVHRWPKRDR